MSVGSGRAAVFLDRDGVLNELVLDPVSGVPEAPLQVQDVRLVPGAAAAAVGLQRLGFLLVCVTNQPAAAKGRISTAELLAVHDRVLRLLRAGGVELAASRICLHHERGVVPGLAGPCECRKPAPGMLLDVAGELEIDLARSWMVGDTDVDMAAGRAAGCSTVLIEHPGSVHKRFHAVSADLVAGSLAEAVGDPGIGMQETVRSN
ncbi:MAG: HAD-IIIA family hydrolase [Solirubrobacteraceae bacterium]